MSIFLIDLNYNMYQIAMYEKVLNTENKSTGMKLSRVALKKLFRINALEIVENDTWEPYWEYVKHHKYSTKYLNNSNLAKYKKYNQFIYSLFDLCLSRLKSYSDF